MSDSSEPGVGEGFLDFSEGWSETVKGWYHEGHGELEAGYGYVAGDDQSMIEGTIENAEGHEQAERGENEMGTGLDEMF
jgi:uncharacterized protein YjbJ (UPF0337 family)